MPLSHLTLTVSHLPTSTSFFLSCLQPLGYQFIGRHDDYIGFGQKQGEPADFWVTEQKPGQVIDISTSAVHVAFPAPSKDAVKTFFISALKAGGQIHGEPKTRDSQTGYYSAAIIDFDGNSIEAVYRPGASVVASEAGGPTIALLENGSVVSKSSKATTVSKATTIKKTESIAPPASEAQSRAVSRAPTAIEKAAPSVVSNHTQSQSRSIPPPTYVQTQTVQKPDDGKAAKTIVGTLIGAAAGAAIAYAMVKGDSQSTESETDKSQTQSQAPSQFIPNAFAQLMAPSQSPKEEEQSHQYRAIEAPPPRSVYTSASASGPRSTLSRSVTSKNPRASTVYEGTEYFDENGRRASDGSIFSIPEDIPLRAIEYPPQGNNSQRYPCSPSTFISSYAADKPRARSLAGQGSIHSASTIKASQTQSATRRHSHDDRASYTSSHHSQTYHAASIHSHQSGAGTAKQPSKSTTGSTASSTRSARNIPLPAGSQATYYSAAPSQNKSHVSAREVPLPESVIDLDVNSNVTPDDSISQVGSRSGRSHHSHRSHRSHSKAGSKASKNSHAHSSKSQFDIPVIPADSVSQASSQRTVKAGSRAHSHAGSRRGSQVV
ncbi:hypothetical protein VI817_007633 [Penicillium citrinum]|nr:hypothetical protein VI817_007633 [Penicillium citrinum]